MLELFFRLILLPQLYSIYEYTNMWQTDTSKEVFNKIYIEYLISNFVP